jgi:hydrogenase maturation protease
MSSVHIFGIGSPAGDDQAGWLTVDALLALGIRAGDGLVIEKLDRPGSALIALLERAERVVLVDAMQGGGEIGQIRHVAAADWPRYRGGLSSHGLGVIDALLLAEELGSLPPGLELYGIEVGGATPRSRPSREIQAAAARLASMIADQLTRRLPSPPGVARG